MSARFLIKVILTSLLSGLVFFILGHGGVGVAFYLSGIAIVIGAFTVLVALIAMVVGKLKDDLRDT